MTEAGIGVRCAAIGRAARGEGDLDAAVADLLRMPAGFPVRGPLAAALIGRLLRDTADGSDVRRIQQVDALLTLADADPPADPGWPRRRCAARAASMLLAIAESRLADPRAALAELATFPDDPAARTLVGLARMAVLREQARADGDEAPLLRVDEEMAAMRERAAGLPGAAAHVDLLDAAYRAWTANERGENPAAAYRELGKVFDRLPAGHPMRSGLDDLMRAAEPFARLLDDPHTPLDPEQVAALGDLAAQPGLSDHDRALLLGGAGLAEFAADSDRDRADAGIDRIRQALRVLPAGNPQRVGQLGLLASGLFRRSELGGGIADLRAAAEALEEARTLAGGPRHPLWATINEMLSVARRRLPGSTDAGRASLDGLRRHAWRALIQSSPAATRSAVRDAARDAVDVARQFLGDDDPAGVLRALDSGRGLALYAATETAGVAERLDRAGHTGLARRWRAAQAGGDPGDSGSGPAAVRASRAGGDPGSGPAAARASRAGGDPGSVPAALRAEVWSALAESGDTALLDPPSLDEIQAALARLDADALVYLVPADGVQPGFAVLAPVSGPPAYLILPFLRVDAEVDVERYLRSLARDLGPAAAPGGDDLAGAVDRMCDWAWRAAIGPLIERALPQVTQPVPGRVPRVVLVPMGELARIPWHAARGGDGRYAVQRIAVSQAASARMLCHSAALAPVPVSPLGLVVGDPDTGGAARDLPAARVEAFAVQRTFYGGARYVGRLPSGKVSPSGAGTAAEVRAWLGGGGTWSGDLLHLACHGVVDTAAGEAYLLLAGGDRLTARDLAGGRDLGLVVLAACHTGRSVHGYDEAYSLGTTFLAAGARSVLSTQWAIPDGATALLMVVFHHHLVVRGMPPWQALREAQLWMLDPDRDRDLLPGPLRAQLDRADPADLVAWAGFTHWGQ
ncbi:hypothetical protein GCM10010168_46530 [Actinoplanes ianthinogenes]|uniref:CHAT domain-containing protein n=1 Tax=Actinoplanes ianthinogenes TaxID=122358 RepID=A0ABM7LP46_9ACTN|nr:CHAT domain-containing protein [Actinoplanes ianthinogenes]BCJ41049.1 hypothetical protein Aiant_17060 [Actinoplanes ianthinogenes]GGR23253.1 hypothetical protein GCM10010168_46530 [Actinoplanes ianthinogenes]